MSKYRLISERKGLTDKQLIYINRYNSIINFIDSHPEYCDDKYCEEHHIFPKCCGGTNNPSNIIKLPFRIHFILHVYMLPVIYPKVRGIWLSAMIFSGMNIDEVKKLSSLESTTFMGRVEEFKKANYGSSKIVLKIRDEARNICFPPELHEKRSEDLRGEKNPFYGKNIRRNLKN